jgi:hypothetical protein
VRGADSFADVVGERAQHLCADLCGHVLAQFPMPRAALSRFLVWLTPNGALTAQSFRDADSRTDVCAFGGEVGDKSDLECAVSIERFRRVEHFGRVGETDQPRQPQEAPRSPPKKPRRMNTRDSPPLPGVEKILRDSQTARVPFPPVNYVATQSTPVVYTI